MATVNLGRIKPVWKGAWSSSTQYIADDIVSYNNSAWIAVATSTNSAPASNNANWSLMAQGLSANSVTSTEIADGAVTSAKLAAGAAIPSQTGNAGKLLTTDGTNASWTNQKVLQTVQLYQSSSQVSVSGEGGTFLSGDFYYPNSLKIGGTFTKQSSTSYLLVWAWYSVWWSTTNAHDFYMWLGGDVRHLGLDPYRMSGNRYNVAAFQMFTGVASGSRSIYLAGGRGDTNTHTAILNYNPSSQISTDTSNENTTSQMVVMEIEP